MTVVQWLNNLDANAATAVFQRCCGSSRWAAAMAASRPFTDLEHLHRAADLRWAEASRADVLEAFGHHPKIGADIDSLRQKFSATATWSEGEQRGVAQANEAVLLGLRDGNVAYEKRFGYIFIVCATGKSAAEMLEILNSRIDNDPETEFAIARGEQAKITHIRLDKLEVP